MGTEYAEDRYWHLEYAVVDSVDPQKLPVHFVDIARDDEDLERKVSPILTSMTGHGDTYALHLRLIGSDIRNEKIYAETQPLAVAMNDVHRLTAQVESLTKKFYDLNAAKGRLAEDYEREVSGIEKRLGTVRGKNDILEMRLDRLRYRARRDLECCVTMEPAEVLDLLDGREDDSMTVSAEAMRERLLAILPTEPMKTRGTPNECDAAEAEWGVYEQIAAILGVTLPLAADEATPDESMRDVSARPKA